MQVNVPSRLKNFAWSNVGAEPKAVIGTISLPDIGLGKDHY